MKTAVDKILFETFFFEILPLASWEPTSHQSCKITKRHINRYQVITLISCPC